MQIEIEQKLQEQGARRLRALQAVERENAAMRALIVEALDAGLTQTRVAVLTGYTQGRIGHIARFVDGDYRKGERRK